MCQKDRGFRHKISGTIYDADHQCTRVQYGTNSSQCKADLFLTIVETINKYKFLIKRIIIILTLDVAGIE